MIKILLSCLTHSFEISKLKYNHDCKTVSCPRVKVSRISQWVCFPKLLVLWSPPSMFWSLLCKHLKEMSSKCFCLSEFRFWSPITLFLFFLSVCLFLYPSFQYLNQTIFEINITKCTGLLSGSKIIIFVFLGGWGGVNGAKVEQTSKIKQK